MDYQGMSPSQVKQATEYYKDNSPAGKRTRSTNLRLVGWGSCVALIFLWGVPNIFSGEGEFPDHPQHRPHHPHGPPHHGEPSHQPMRSHGCGHSTMSNGEVEQLMLTWPDTDKLAEWSKYYTEGAHLAGKNLSQAEWTRDRWEEFGVAATIAPYNVYINYPVDHRLGLLEAKSGEDEAWEKGDWSVKFEAELKEDVLEDDPTTDSPQSIPTFHGYSANGNVTAQYVYVNYGSYQDFEDLVKANVELKGNIAIARYGGNFRGLKVKRAQELGMVGAVLYTDPGDDHGAPGREESSVQRGSVAFLSIAPGDPTTIGKPSIPGVERNNPEGYIPSIPSIPISYRDALPILKSLNGHGPAAKDMNKWWTKDTGLGDKGVNYNIGPSPSNLKLNLMNEQEYVYQDIWNVIGVINGTIPDEVIVVGNHRDAWIVGGAGDPNSGSAALMEVVRGFGHATSKGWQPLRTIVFASWDGEEYGLVGSTEWVEQYIPWLSAAAVSYVNIDVGCAGPKFTASASPLLNSLIYNVTGMVQSPNQTTKGQTVKDVWDGHISTMGSGSDFTSFQDWAGIPSLDFGFGPDEKSPVYHYHSNYDSYHWMATEADPGFKYHQTASTILGLMVAKLANQPMIPMVTGDYGNALKTYIKKLEDKLDASQSQDELRHIAVNSDADKKDLLVLQPVLADLQASADEFIGRASRFDWLVENLKQKVRYVDEIPWWKFWEKLQLFKTVRKTNTKLKYLERQFLYEGGLDGREYFKHVIFAPGLWTGYSGAVFPGLSEAIDRADVEAALRWAKIIKERIHNAAETLKISVGDMH